MFKKFNPKEDVASQAQVKSSIQRGIRSRISEQMPTLAIDDLLPKKTPLFLVKCLDRVTIVNSANQYLFFSCLGPYYPNLKVLHAYPDILPQVRVDTGAIKFVLKGADIMCPGLTSKGGDLPTIDYPPGTPVAVMAEGKEHAIAIGLLSLSISDIKSINRGIGVENIHFLGDGLYKLIDSPVTLVPDGDHDE